MKGMKKKKLWIECEGQKRIVKTLDDSIKFLRLQNVEVQNNIRAVEANMSLSLPLGHALRQKHLDLLNWQETQVSAVRPMPILLIYSPVCHSNLSFSCEHQLKTDEEKLAVAKARLGRLEKKAEKMGLAESQFQGDDLPDVMSELDSAIDVSSSYINSIMQERESEKSRRDMSNMRSSFHRLFMFGVVKKAVKTKKRKPRQGAANSYLDDSYLDESFASSKRGKKECAPDDKDSGENESDDTQ